MPEEKKPYIVDGQRVTLEEYRKINNIVWYP